MEIENFNNVLSLFNKRFCKGDIVRHFKYWLDADNPDSNKYVYQIDNIGYHSETKEPLLIYRSLSTNQIWVRPLEEFLSKVDKQKYPDERIKQNYRFEKCL